MKATRTAAQRYNDRMFKMFEDAKKLKKRHAEEYCLLNHAHNAESDYKGCIFQDTQAEGAG